MLFWSGYSCLSDQLTQYEIETAIKQTVRSYQFPEEDLLRDLVDIHFRISHSTIPIIYEPRFRKNIQQGLHHYDPDFGALVLMMCALSSRDSSDPRVYLPGQNQYSAGWKYYEQIPTMRQSVTNPPSLHELQMYCVRCISLTSDNYHWKQVRSWRFSTRWVLPHRRIFGFL